MGRIAHVRFQVPSHVLVAVRVRDTGPSIALLLSISAPLWAEQLLSVFQMLKLTMFLLLTSLSKAVSFLLCLLWRSATT